MQICLISNVSWSNRFIIMIFCVKAGIDLDFYLFLNLRKDKKCHFIIFFFLLGKKKTGTYQYFLKLCSK